MGEIAEMMLDGTLCNGCGVYLPGNGDGIPRWCGDCKRDLKTNQTVKAVTKTKCAICGKLVKGLADHVRVVHGDSQGKGD